MSTPEDAYNPCREMFCAREASHHVKVHNGPRSADKDYCVDHAAEVLVECGEVTVRPLRGGDKERESS